MLLSTSSRLGWRCKERRNRATVQRMGGYEALISDLARSRIPAAVARRSATISVAALALALLASPPAHAQNLVTDGSFEDTQLSSGSYEYVNGLLNGWTYSGLAVLINVSDSSPWITPSTQTGYDGNQIAGVQETG